MLQIGPQPSSSASLERLHVIGLQGLGDNIYQRAFIKPLSRQWDIYLETSWPELYADLPVQFVNPETRLRTQRKNVVSSKVPWTRRPIGCRHIRRNSYVKAFQSGRSLIQGMEDSFGITFDAAEFDLPALPPSPLIIEKPVAFFRPVTLRREWSNPARNPEPSYLIQIAEALRPTHTIVTVADLMPNEEWLIGPQIKADREFIRGELKAMDMLALLASADIVIGGVGFIVPASIALKRDCFVVLGGQGGHNAPSKILDPRLDCSHLGFATPKDFCPCTNMRHGCNKTIPDLLQQFSRFRTGRAYVTSSPKTGCNGSPNAALATIP